MAREKRSYDKQFKESVLARVLGKNEDVSSISDRLKIPKSTIVSWVNAEKEKMAAKKSQQVRHAAKNKTVDKVQGYPETLKLYAVNEIREKNRTLREVAEELGISPSCVFSWNKTIPVKRVQAQAQAESPQIRGVQQPKTASALQEFDAFTAIKKERDFYKNQMEILMKLSLELSTRTK